MHVCQCTCDLVQDAKVLLESHVPFFISAETLLAVLHHHANFFFVIEHAKKFNDVGVVEEALYFDFVCQEIANLMVDDK